MPRKYKDKWFLTNPEKYFCKLIAEEGLGSIQAARKAFGWRCEPDDPEYMKARNLARTPRVKKYVDDLKKNLEQQAEAESIVSRTQKIDYDSLRKFAYKRLEELRDDENIPAQAKFKAIEALEKLSDPSKDVNLIWKWIDTLVRGSTVHCPCCHKTYHAEKLILPEFQYYRQKNKIQSSDIYENIYDRRNEIFQIADRRNRPHEGQIQALSALERHIIGLGAARAGKSYLMALFAVIYFLVPGTEVWLLARIYEDARSEREYLENFINSIFYPHASHLITTNYDSKSGEWTMRSRWGSEIKIKSAKAAGSLTGRELDAVLAAEPGWMPEEIYNHVRARLSSRLGRIIALGTPQGLDGFLSRLVFTTGRDPKTGKVRRLTAEDRLLDNGASWNISALVMNLTPDMNPAYVKGELDAARQEMSDDEYASEFEGKMVSGEGMKFNAIQQRHLINVDRNKLMDCEWILGIDQGQKNFGAVLGAYNGHDIFVMRDYFEGEFNTIRTNLLELRNLIPVWIRTMGGEPTRWKMTIFDQDPPVQNTLIELENDYMVWPTNVTYRHDNRKVGGITEDWRKDTTVYVNEMAKQNRLFIDMECSQLHDELMRTINVGGNRELEGGGSSRHKGWKLSNSWREDHVMDAFMFLMWVILSNQVETAPEKFHKLDPMEEARRAFEFKIKEDERKELGYRGSSEKTFEDVFGRKRGSTFVGYRSWYYSDY